MIYLSSPPANGRKHLYEAAGIGVMHTPWVGNSGRSTQGLVWAADTGCFRWPERFDLKKYLDWLDRWSSDIGTPPLFATAPDVVGDPVETWRRSEPVLEQLRDRGHVAALVAQDWVTEIPWDTFDCLFIGGTTCWKLSPEAAALTVTAVARGKTAHMGRVNSLRRLKYAAGLGCHSADGNYIAFGPTVNIPRVIAWLAEVNA